MPTSESMDSGNWEVWYLELRNFCLTFTNLLEYVTKNRVKNFWKQNPGKGLWKSTLCELVRDGIWGKGLCLCPECEQWAYF